MRSNGFGGPNYIHWWMYDDGQLVGQGVFTSARGEVSAFSYSRGFDELLIGAYQSLSAAQTATPSSYQAISIDNVQAELTAPVVGVLANDTDADGDPLTASLVTGPSHGTLVLNANGTFTYTPDANYNGPDSFTYRAYDGKAYSDPATVFLTVTPVDDAPMAAPDSASTPEDNSVTVAVLGNDTDPDNLTGPANAGLTVTAVTPAAHGSVSFTGTTVTYTPHADYNGADSFTYTVADPTGRSSTATVTIDVTPVNDAPVARNDAATTDEDNAVMIDVLANDLPGPANEVGVQTIAITELNGQTATVGVPIATDHGSVVLNADGTVTYTPNQDYHGADGFSYTITDSGSPPESATTTGTVAINPVNDPPVALDDAFAGNEDTVIGGDVLANDTDVDGDTLSASLVSGPAQGSLALNPDGSFTYTPAADFHGTVSFTYRATDGVAYSDVATVTITVAPVNDAPVAGDDTAATDEDTAVTGSVLGNDSDVDGDALSASLATGPVHGQLVLNGDGTFTYTPDANYNGSDSFTYTVSDGQGGTDTGTVAITVRSVNDAPVAGDDVASTAEDTPVSGNVLANDTDIDGDVLSASLVSAPAHGMLTLNADGSFTYMPGANYHGPDSFTYQVDDGNGGTAQATVSITVTPVNDAPVADDQSVSTDEDTGYSGSVTATDVEGDGLSYALVTGPSNGTLVFNSDGTFTYTPNANYNGADSFTYKVNDGSLDSNPATVSISVVAVNDAPAAANDAYATNEDTALTVAAPGVLGNDSDVDGDTLSVALASGPAHGALTLNADGSFTYTPAANYNGSDSFTYTLSDGHGGTATGTVTLSVAAVNDAPVLVSVTGPDGPQAKDSEVTVTADFTDVDTTDTHTATWDWGDGTPTTVTNANGAGSVAGTHTYTAAGVYTVTVTVSDNNGGTSAAMQYQYVVVYDPSAGFVTGGGWINSPTGAYAADPSLSGKATFGFVAKYQTGANTPTGQTEFQFKLGNFTFKSTDYQWLVVGGGKAKYKGTGTVNGVGGYSFMLTAVDGQNGSPDKFRIKIWNAGGVVYDNQMGASDDSYDATDLGGGSIVIHK